jgi:autotransporter-associated beta strand protein
MQLRFHSYLFMITSLLTLGLMLHAASAATYTWDGEGGDGNPALDAAVNWNPDGVPPFSASASDTYLFAGSSPTVPIMVQAGGAGMLNMTFDAGTAFAFSADDLVADAITMGSTTVSMNITNNSAGTQTFNVQVAPYRGSINATEGDIIFQGLLNIGAGATSSYVSLRGGHDIYIQGAGGGLVGMAIGTTNWNNNGNLVIGNTSGSLGGTVYIDVDSPESSLNQNGGRWNGMISIYRNNLRISTTYALGEGGADHGITRIRSGDNMGALELVNNLTIGEEFMLDPRNSDATPHIVNVSGNQTLTGPLVTMYGGGTYLGLQSDSGLLTVQGDWTLSSDSANASRTIILRGASNGRMEGKIDNIQADLTISLTKLDSGTWTLTNPYNAYNGTTTIAGGTLALEGSGAIAYSPAIDVQAGAYFDVSGLSSTFTLGSTQTLKGNGTIVGSVVAAAGSKIESGESAGTLTIDGDLNMSADDSGTGAGMTWELAALADDATPGTPGTDYDLTVVTGNVTLGGASLLTLDFNQIADPNDRPDAASPVAFWLTSHSWKILDAATNTGDTNFAGLAPVTTPEGWSFTTSVGTGDHAGDVYLNYVPEPSSFLLLGLGLLGFLGIAKARRR